MTWTEVSVLVCELGLTMVTINLDGNRKRHQNAGSDFAGGYFAYASRGEDRGG